MRVNVWLRMLAVLALCLPASRAALAIEVGAAGPEFQVTEWIQGDPVKLSDSAGTKTWLVLFWGTFESVDSAEALTATNKLYDKHKDKGFDVIAFSSEPPGVVRNFIAEHKVGFRVVVDQSRKMLEAYGKEIRKLPWSCLVDKTGVVVWHGDPTSGLAAILPDVVDGKFDLGRAKALQTRSSDLWQAYWQALFGNKWDELAVVVDKVLAADPTDEWAFNLRLQVFEHKQDVGSYKAFMKAHLDRCKDDAQALRRAAQRLAVGGDFGDIDLALSTIRRAVDVSKGTDASVIDAHAQVLYTIGMLDQAIVEEKKAVALDAKDEDYKKTLAYYEACVAARKKATTPEKPAPPKKK